MSRWDKILENWEEVQPEDWQKVLGLQDWKYAATPQIESRHEEWRSWLLEIKEYGEVFVRYRQMQSLASFLRRTTRGKYGVFARGRRIVKGSPAWVLLKRRKKEDAGNQEGAPS